MLSLYQSPVNSRSRKAEGNSMQNYQYYSHFQAWNYIPTRNSQQACLLKEKDMVEFSYYTPSWKITFKQMTSNVVISCVDALIYVVLSKVEKHLPYTELVGITECITLYPRCRTNRGRYN
jgi:hypothetical protein